MAKNKRVEHREGEMIGECFFISYAPNDSHQVRRVNVRCRCGNVFETRYSAIKIGRTKSCGCLQRDSARKQAIEYTEGEKIGHLVFLNRAGMSGESSLGNFLCQCGSQFVTRIQTAKEGRVKSCGCMTQQLLNKTRIKYHPVDKVVEGGMTKYKPIPSIPFKEQNRFWSKVKLTANPFVCWNWTGTGDRYGSFRMGAYMYKSNRVAYFLHYSVDPKEMEVMHSCDNPKCCNPNHLSLGNHFENMQDMANKGRANNGVNKKIV